MGWGLLWLIPIIIIHEAGHILYDYNITGKRPKLSFHASGFGFVLNQSKHTIKTAIFTSIAGMLTGFLATAIIVHFFLDATGLNPLVSYMLYLLLCSSDFTMVGLLIDAKNSYGLKWSTPLPEVPCERCKYFSQKELKEQKKKKR